MGNDYEEIKRLHKINKIRFVLDVAPCSAPRMSQSDKWKRRPIVTKYFAFKDELRLKCGLVGYDLEEVLDIAFVVEMPKSWSKKKRSEMLYERHLQRPDRDNFLKAFQDAFLGDDGFVADGRTLKIWGNKAEIIIF